MDARWFGAALVVAGCNGDASDTAPTDESDADTDSDIDSDTDADTDSDTDTDTDSDADTDASWSSLTATGVFDGAKFDVACPPADVFATRADSTGVIVVSAICANVGGNAWAIGLNVVNPAEETSATCDANHNVQVMNGASGEQYWCYEGGATSFELTLTDVADLGDGSTHWAGTFAVAGTDGVHTASAVGEFDIVSKPF